MAAKYDEQKLFVFEPAIDGGLRAGVFDGYGGVNNLDIVRKRAAINTWMAHARHEATEGILAKKIKGYGYLDELEFDLGDINNKCTSKVTWNFLQLAANKNNTGTDYDDKKIKEYLERFNQFWNSEHNILAEAASKKPYTEGSYKWKIVHANQQPGLVKLFSTGILDGDLPTYGGHQYQNQQGRGGLLPKRNKYWVYDYDTGKSTRGAARVVVGPADKESKREIWFTDDHYGTFVRVIKGHNKVLDAHK
jgi:hypothetical protein